MDGSFRVADEILVSFRVDLECINPMQLPTSLGLSTSVESEWQTSADPHEERLRLDALERRQMPIHFAIPFDGPSDKLDFGYLGSLSKMKITFAVEQPGTTRWYLATSSFLPMSSTVEICSCTTSRFTCLCPL